MEGGVGEGLVECVLFDVLGVLAVSGVVGGLEGSVGW